MVSALKFHLAEYSLNLQVGDQIIWQGEEIKSENGLALVSRGMKGKVLSLHDGAHLDVVRGGSIPVRAFVEFESGASLLVDKRHKWEKVSKK